MNKELQEMYSTLVFSKQRAGFILAIIICFTWYSLTTLYFMPRSELKGFQQGISSEQACQQINSSFLKQTDDSNIVVCKNGQLAQLTKNK